MVNKSFTYALYSISVQYSIQMIWSQIHLLTTYQQLDNDNCRLDHQNIFLKMY